MALRDLIKRLRRGYEDASDSLAEQVNRARTYLDENAPGLESGVQTGLRGLLQMTPGLSQAVNVYGPDQLKVAPPRTLADALKTPLQPLGDIANAGNQIAGEPLAYGINRLPGIGNDQLQIGDKTISAGGPWSGLQRHALLQGGQNAGGAAEVAAKAGVAGIDIATNPLTYVGTGSLPLLAQLGLGALGIGGFGGESATAKVARAMAGGAGMAAGSDIAGSVTGGNPLAEMAGGFAGAALAHRVGATTPGLGSLFKDAEGAAVQRPRSPADLLRPPVLAADAKKPVVGDVFIRGVPSPEAARVDLQRGTSLHQYGGDIDSIMESANISPRVRRLWREGELSTDSPQVQEALADAGIAHIPGVGLAQKLDGLAGWNANDPQWGWERFQSYHGTGTPYVAVFEGTNVPFANDAQLAGESAALFKPRRLLGIVPSDQFNPAEWTEDAINARLRTPPGVPMGISEGAGSVRGVPPTAADAGLATAPPEGATLLANGYQVKGNDLVWAEGRPYVVVDSYGDSGLEAYPLHPESGQPWGARTTLNLQKTPVYKLPGTAYDALLAHTPVAGGAKPLSAFTAEERAATTDTLMHGTGRQFGSFDPLAKTNKQTRRGGFFFTLRPDVADRFAWTGGSHEYINDESISAALDSGRGIGNLGDILPRLNDWREGRRSLTVDELRAIADARMKEGRPVFVSDADGNWTRVTDTAQITPQNYDAGLMVQRRGFTPSVMQVDVPGYTLDLRDPRRMPPDLMARLAASTDRWDRRLYDAAQQRGGYGESYLEVANSPTLEQYAAERGITKILTQDAYESGHTSVYVPDPAVIERTTAFDVGSGLPVSRDVAPDPTVALHAGIPLTKGRAIGALLGGTAGALWPADSPEERQMNMAKGLGLGLGAAVVGPQLLKVKNTLLTPAALREPELGAALVRYNNGVRSVAATTAARARAAALPVEKTLAQEVRAGNVRLNAPGQVAVNTAVADARTQLGSTPLGDEVVNRIRDNTYASALIGEHPEYYDFATPAAQSLVADIRAQYDGIYAKAAANGVAPQQTRANYVNRAWDVPRSGSAAVKGKPLGTKQSYMRQASFDDFLQGLSQGYVPKSLNVSDLIAQHAAAVETAIAQRQLVDKILATPGWSFNPKVWNPTTGTWTTRPVPDGYRAFDAPAFRKMFGTLDTADVRQAIAAFETDALARGAPDAAARQQLLSDLREEVGAGRSQIYVRDDVAQALDAAFDPQGALAQFGDKTLGVAREAALGVDVAMAGRVTPSMWLQAMAGSNPLSGTAAIGKALWWSINPRAAQEARLSATWQQWAPHFGNVGPKDLGAVLEQTGVEQSVLRRVPLVGRLLQWMEDWQFNTLIPNLEVATAEAIYRRKAGQIGKMGDSVVRDAIAARVETVAAGVSRMRAGTSRDQEALLRTFLLSPNFTRGALRTIQMLGTPGLEGELARRQAALMATTGLALVTGLSMAFQGDVSLDALDRIANPTNPDSVTNPRSRNFMKIVLGDGANVDIWGQFTPVFRAMLKPFAAGIGAGNEAYQHPTDGQNPLYNAVATGLHAAFGMEGTEPWRDWAENRLSIPLAAGRNLLKNEDMLGNAITNAEDGDRRKWDQVKYIGRQFFPGVADIGLATDTGAQPEYGVSPDSVQKGVGQALGINVTPGPNDPTAVTDKVSAFLQQNGIAPGVDPLTSYRRAINDKDVIPLDVAARFRADNPDIDKHIADTRAKREALKQQPVGPEAAREYNTARANAQAQRTAALGAAAAQYAQDHDGNAYRKAVERAWTLYQGGLQTSAKTILGVDTLADAQARIDKAYGGKDPSSAPAARAFDEYESMRVLDNATPDQRDMALEARRLFLAPGGTADQKYGAGTGDILQRTIRDRYRAEGGETYAQYFDAQQTMGQYAAISPYIGMDARTARRAGVALDRARALHQYGLTPSPILALFQDNEIDPATRLAALRILRYGKSMVNPQRMMFRWQNPKMLTFYGDLNNEDYNRLTGAA